MKMRIASETQRVTPSCACDTSRYTVVYVASLYAFPAIVINIDLICSLIDISAESILKSQYFRRGKNIERKIPLMSLRCGSSLSIPNIPVVRDDGQLYEESQDGTEYRYSTGLIRATLPIQPFPESISPTLATPSRNIGSLIALMRTEMDSLFHENLVMRTDLTIILERISREKRLRENAGAKINKLLTNAGT